MKRLGLLLLLIILLFAVPMMVQAHVKWFTDFSFTDPPLPLNEAITSTFIALTILSFVALAVLVFVEARLKTMSWYERATKWFEDRREHALLVLRLGMGITLLLSWQADTLLAPDLIVPPWVGWLQFAVALLLIFPFTTPLAGIGVILLYILGIAFYGVFYMLDYFLFVGVGVYLMVARHPNARIRGLRIPALYFAVGFSLCWVALEKIIYPQWGLYILQQNPQLTMGLDTQFFLLAAAFIEFVLGYLLIIALLERPIALAVTLVFFTTTLVFGKVEVIGHTIIHAALIVFLLEGPGRIYPAPIAIHQRLWVRAAFAAVNFLLLLVLLLVPYAQVAQLEHQQSVATVEEAVP